MAISNELLASTLYSIRDSEVSLLDKKSAFLDWAKKKGGVEVEDGGIKIQRHLSIYEHSSVTPISNGYESVSLAVRDVGAPAIYDWCDLVAPVVISRKEELENSGDKAVVKILEKKMQSVMGMLTRGVNKQILQGSLTGYTALNTLNGFSVSTGFLEEGARTTSGQTNSVGGISKNGINVTGWYNWVSDASDDFSANGLSKMADLQVGVASLGLGKVDLIIASTSAFANYQTTAQLQQQFINAKEFDTGRMVLMHNGAPVEMDSDMPTNSGTQYSMYFLNFSGIKLVMHKEGQFKLSPFQNIPGTTTRGCDIYWKGQLVADHLGSQGVLINGDTI